MRAEFITIESVKPNYGSTSLQPYIISIYIIDSMIEPLRKQVSACSLLQIRSSRTFSGHTSALFVIVSLE